MVLDGLFRHMSSAIGAIPSRRFDPGSHVRAPVQLMHSTRFVRDDFAATGAFSFRSILVMAPVLAMLADGRQIQQLMAITALDLRPGDFLL